VYQLTLYNVAKPCHRSESASPLRIVTVRRTAHLRRTQDRCLTSLIPQAAFRLPNLDGSAFPGGRAQRRAEGGRSPLTTAMLIGRRSASFTDP